MHACLCVRADVSGCMDERVCAHTCRCVHVCTHTCMHVRMCWQGGHLTWKTWKKTGIGFSVWKTWKKPWIFLEGSKTWKKPGNFIWHSNVWANSIKFCSVKLFNKQKKLKLSFISNERSFIHNRWFFVGISTTKVIGWG